MLGELITLPLRVGVRATQLWLRAAEQTAAVVADATERLIDRGVTSGPGARERDRGVREPARLVTGPDPRTDGERDPGPEPGPEPERAHVSEESVVVDEIAEPGAEDGAGAQVRIEEPWEGYGRLKADDVVDRLAGASIAELAAIQLYESETKGRSTVLDAVERELRISTGSGSQS